jgi:hypothetical protein|tara:strand:- start:148 stop:345 length:198 start_codon:yes stop_codon:yes gene_type:complete
LEEDCPYTHNLRLLMQLTPDGSEWGVTVEEIAPLNRYSVETRYPGAWGPFSRTEAEAAVPLLPSG